MFRNAIISTSGRKITTGESAVPDGHLSVSCIAMQLKVVISPSSDLNDRLVVHGGELIGSNSAVVDSHLYYLRWARKNGFGQICMYIC